MASRLEAHLARSLARDGGLSVPDFDVLTALTDAPERRLCLKDVAAGLLWSPSRLSHHLDRMQARDLVRRVPCPEGRGSDVETTERGVAAVTAAAPAHDAAVRDAFVDVISRKDLATLGRIAEAVLENLADAPDA
nr:MarR family winged helix-turn-helix transcriptional regulator [Blastococcus saxobsidens]